MAITQDIEARTSEVLALYDNARLYDDQNADVTEDLPFWAMIASRYAKLDRPILEMGAGTGRVSLALADLGYLVKGLDLSPDMLALAERKALDLDPESRGRLEFLRGDIRSYSEQEGQYPLIIFPYNSITHLTTNQEIDDCLGNTWRMLEAGGRFVFAVFVPLPKFLNRDPDALYPVGSFKDSQNGATIDLFESMHYDRWTQINHVTWYFFRENDEQPYIRNLSLRMFYPQDTEYLLRAHGFEMEERYGDYDCSPISADSVVQLVVARKP